MEAYSTKQHSSLLKMFGQKMDEIEKDKTKELIFNILLPVRKMNDEVYNLTSEYIEFTENKESLTFLNQLNIFNNNIMKILKNEPIEFPSTNTPSNSSTTPPNASNGHHNNNNNSETNSNSNSNTNTAANPDELMPLHQLIDLLVQTDIQPIQYDNELLINCLISREITNENVVSKKNAMIAILEDCRFPPNRAQFTFEQIERNLSSSQQHHIPDNHNINNDRTNAINGSGPIGNGHVDNNNEDETEDSMGVKVIDLTIMAIEGVFEGQVHVNRDEIGKIYRINEIDTAKLSCMTEAEFGDILTQCSQGSNFSKNQCIKIHRAIKTLLNINIQFRFNIDIALAIIYLINEKQIFTHEKIIKPQKIIAAFKNYDAKQVLKMGKKGFIKILQTQTHIKMGHATKLWNSIKAYIEDSNLQIPKQILIKENENENENENANENEIESNQQFSG